MRIFNTKLRLFVLQKVRHRDWETKQMSVYFGELTKEDVVNDSTWAVRDVLSGLVRDQLACNNGSW